MNLGHLTDTPMKHTHVEISHQSMSEGRCGPHVCIGRIEVNFCKSRNPKSLM